MVYTLTGDDQDYGEFDDISWDGTDQGVVYFNYAHFSTETVTVSTSGGVPEPATWGLMLIGFGGLGLALRRRRGAGALGTI